MNQLDHLSTSEVVKRLADPYWRLRNIYWVANKEGRPVLFQPWPEQEKFLDEIWHRNVIPKARQRGFSTVVQLLMLDACLFVPNTNSAVIAQDEPSALKIFDTKIKFAWDRLPPIVRSLPGLNLVTDNKHEMKWGNDSSFYVATSTRSGTLQYLHVSEYGQICAKFPDRAREIQEGSLPSVDQHGVIVIESTVETPFGPFADMVRTAQKHQEQKVKLSPLHYRLHFASWWDADEYETDPDTVVISSVDHAYFERIEAEIGQKISLRKRAWYVAKRDNDFGGDAEKMWRQYPSTLKEAFTISSEGLWLSQQMVRARSDGRIGRFPILSTLPINTFWDIGVDDDNAVWLHQRIGPWDNWVGYFESRGEPYSYLTTKLNAHRDKVGFSWGTHYLPHDANQRRPGAESLKTSADMLEALGFRNQVIVPRVANVGDGIQQLREDFATYRFDEEACKEGLVHLDGFSKVWNERMGLWTPDILKNGHQHAADALRQKAQIAHELRESGGPNRPKRRNRSGMAA